jgi:hypothetical protein
LAQTESAFQHQSPEVDYNKYIALACICQFDSGLKPSASDQPVLERDHHPWTSRFFLRDAGTADAYASILTSSRSQTQNRQVTDFSSSKQKAP